MIGRERISEEKRKVPVSSKYPKALLLEWPGKGKATSSSLPVFLFLARSLSLSWLKRLLLYTQVSSSSRLPFIFLYLPLSPQILHAISKPRYIYLLPTSARLDTQTSCLNFIQKPCTVSCINFYVELRKFYIGVIMTTRVLLKINAVLKYNIFFA